MAKKITYTHEDRQKFVEQAAKEYYDKEIGTPPPLNRDFMKKDSVEIKRHRLVKRCSAIAAAVVLVLLAGTTISMVTSNDTAYGDKGILHRLYQSVMGIGTDKQDEESAGEYSDSFETNSMDDIDKAIAFADGHLYVPEYIPAKYKLDILTIEKAGDNSMIASYTLKKGKQLMNIIEMYSPTDDQISASGEGETIHLKDRIIFVKDDGTGEKVSVDVYTEDIVCTIGGDITKAEAIQIAKGLKQH